MTIKPLSAVRAKQQNDNKLITPRDTLQDVMHEIDEGGIEPESALVLLLNRGEDGTSYDTNFFVSNLSTSEILALLKVIETQVLQEMNFIPPHY